MELDVQVIGLFNSHVRMRSVHFSMHGDEGHKE